MVLCYLKMEIFVLASKKSRRSLKRTKRKLSNL
nr:MAG TPA: hypothetical protein [Crassvirales sp.]